jgi:hypothetical protein
MLGLSVFGHAAVLAGWIASLSMPPPLPAPPIAKLGATVLERAGAETGRTRVAAARRDLVERARRDLKRGDFGLGEFLIRAGEIDAEELGRRVDGATVRLRYRDRVDAVRALLERGDVREAAPMVFGDLRYFGRPGGTMVDALLERGGSCEPLAQLVVAAAYDAGRGAEVALRYYGGGGSTPHLAAIAFSYDGDEWDLSTGRPAHLGGVRFPPEELVEIYARAHDVDGKHAPGGGGGDAAEEPLEKLATMAAGYPKNDDRFPGGVPLYAAHAFATPSQPRAEGLPAIDGSDMSRECAAFVGIGVLDPPSITVRPDLEVEPRRTPSPAELERKASWIHGVEEFLVRRDSDDADKLMSLACLSVLGETTAIDFELAGDRELATTAQKRAVRARDEGARRIADVAWEADEGAVIRARIGERYAGRAWLLAALPGGADVALDVVRDIPSDDPASSLAALVVAPTTRTRAIAATLRLPRADQIAVMRGVFAEHANLAPWMPNGALDDDPSDPAGAPFRRAYGVYRGLAFRSMSSARPVAETIAAFDREADARGLDEEWRAVLLADYGQNALAYAASRPDGMTIVRVLDRAFEKRRHPALVQFRRMLREIEAQGRVDPESLPEYAVR